MTRDLAEAPGDAGSGRGARVDPRETLRLRAGRQGFHRHLDDAHTATLIRRGPVLLVAFEDLATLERDDGRTVGLATAEARAWSLLQLTTAAPTWFRGDAVADFFDEMVDDDLFEGFDTVAFYGAGMGGYAAAAYSVVAPGARVLAVAPQTTLDPERAGWDHRFPEAGQVDFTGRYGDAVRMSDGAERVFVVFDPRKADDARHAALFSGAHVSLVPARRFEDEAEPGLATVLARMGVLDRMIGMVASGEADAAVLHATLRARREFGPYLRALLSASVARGGDRLTALLCQHVLKGGRAPAFRRQLRLSADKLTADGARPDWLVD